jgi:hypothetical protein
MMKLRILGAAALSFALAAAAGAQTKVSGTVTCMKADVAGSADVGDVAGHSMALLKTTCNWTKPMDLNGDHTKQDALVISSEMWATRTVSNGDAVGTLDNGDKFLATIHETATVKDGQPVGPVHGTWTLKGLTGKVKGLTGKGTYTTTYNADGTGTSTVEGEYTAPAAKPAAAKPATK